MFPLLGVLFLKHLVELVRFLAQTCKGLLSGIGFLSAFLSGTEIGFFRSPFSKRRQSQESCVVYAPPCLLQGCRVSRYKLSGTVVSTRSHVPILSLCEGVLLQEATDVSDLTWPHTRSVVLRDIKSERMSTGVPPFS